MKTDNRLWIRDFFAEDNKILILPFAAEKTDNGYIFVENCQKLFKYMGLQSFIAKASITFEDDMPHPCKLIFASDSFNLYDHYFLTLLIKTLLPHTIGHVSFIRWKIREYHILRGHYDRFLTFLIRGDDKKYRISQIEKSPTISRKVKVILGVLSKNPKIKIETDTPNGPFELLSAEPPSLEVWRGLYLNAEAFVNYIIENGNIPHDIPKNESGVFSGRRFMDLDDIYYSIEVSSKKLYLKESAQRTLLDAGLSCGRAHVESPELMAYNNSTQKSEKYYWDLLKHLYKNLDLKYVALSHGYTEAMSYTDIRYQDDPLSGLNGNARLQVVTDAMSGDFIDFPQYLALSEASANVPHIQKKEKHSILDELFDEDNFLISCLPVKMDQGIKFPEKALATLCIDCPAIMAESKDNYYQIFFPHYFNNRAISKEDYTNLMLMLAMLLNLKCLLIQNGTGKLFKINTDTNSDDLGEVSIICNGPIYDYDWWVEMLEKTYGSKWKFGVGSIRGKEIVFETAGFFNRSPAFARSAARGEVLAGSNKLKTTCSFTGSCKNVLLHEPGEQNYLFYKEFMTQNNKKIPQSFFNDGTPVLFMDISSLDEENKKDIVNKATAKGCLVCLVDQKRGLLAKPLFPPRDFKDYWAWLKKQSQEFIGISLGKPWYIPSSLDIEEFFIPLGWRGLYIS